MASSDSADTSVHLRTLATANRPVPQVPSSLVEVDLAAESHIGKVRRNNEDHFLVQRFERTLQTLLTNLPTGAVPARASETGYAMLVADGMGGAAAGEVASKVAISTLVELVLQTPDWILRPEGEWYETVLQRMSERLQKVDAALADLEQDNPGLSGMGTTMTLAGSLGATLIVVHVGDSRAYLVRNKKIHRLTRDQTLAQSLEDSGMVSRESAAAHPFRHVLTQSVGRMAGNLKAEVGHATLKDGDAVLVCSDGLTDMVAEHSILEIIQRSQGTGDACRDLIQAALDGGGRDNITVTLARYRYPPDSMT